MPTLKSMEHFGYRRLIFSVFHKKPTAANSEHVSCKYGNQQSHPAHSNRNSFWNIHLKIFQLTQGTRIQPQNEAYQKSCQHTGSIIFSHGIFGEIFQVYSVPNHAIPSLMFFLFPSYHALRKSSRKKSPSKKIIFFKKSVDIFNFLSYNLFCCEAQQ